MVHLSLCQLFVAHNILKKRTNEFSNILLSLNSLLSWGNEFESSASGTQTMSYVQLKFITTMQYMIPLFCYVQLILPVNMEKKREYKMKDWPRCE